MTPRRKSYTLCTDAAFFFDFVRLAFVAGQVWISRRDDSVMRDFGLRSATFDWEFRFRKKTVAHSALDGRGSGLHLRTHGRRTLPLDDDR
jgi:hypothetical protein